MNKETRNTFAKIMGVALTAVLALATAPSASAQDWNHVIALYGIGASIEGDAVFKGIEAEIDVPFDQVLDNLEAGGMVRYRASNDRHIIAVDAIFLGLGDSKDQPPIHADLDMFVLQFDYGFRVSEVWDWYAGIRYTTIEAKVQAGGPEERKFTSSDNFFDPVVGIRAVVPLSDRWNLQAQGDVGGFSVGMNLTWQIMGHVGFQASDAVSVWLGYRALAQDFANAGTNNNLSLDVVYHGPSVAVGFHF